MAKNSRITNLPHYKLIVPICAEVECVRDSYGGRIFYASAEKKIGIDLAGEGYTPAEALRDLAEVIDREYRFMTAGTHKSRLTGYAKNLVDMISPNILSGTKAA